MPKICERLKLFMTLAWHTAASPGTEARALHWPAGTRGVKGVGSPCKEGAGAGAGAGAGLSRGRCWHPSIFRMAPSLRRAPSAPQQGTQPPSLQRPRVALGAAKAARGMFCFYVPLVSSAGEEPGRELHPPPAPWPVAGALRFCSLARDLAKRRSARAKGEMAERVRCSPSKLGMGGPAAGSCGTGGTPKAEAEPCSAALAVPHRARCRAARRARCSGTGAALCVSRFGF